MHRQVQIDVAVVPHGRADAGTGEIDVEGEGVQRVGKGGQVQMVEAQHSSFSSVRGVLHNIEIHMVENLQIGVGDML